MEKEKIEKLAFLEIHGDGEVYKDALKLATKWYVRGYQQAQKDFLTWYTTGDNKHYVGGKLIEAYKKEVLNM